VVALTDADLVARVLLDDDHHAFAELVRNHQSSVRGLLRNLTRTDVALADDLAQETFLRVYKNLRSFRGEARFSTWLYRIAYNCFREEARKRKELVGIDEERLQSEQDPQTVDPALRHDLMHALSLLPLHERSAVLLCCQNGLSHDEAARVLDIPLGTVKTNVLRGREKLKRTLAAWGPS
jgi:RNA polymerase sigma-70 factor (ECF subfamily)